MQWAQKGKAAVLLDGAYGSTGKGQIAAWLAVHGCPDGVDIATTNAGAQAGHTTRYMGDEFICYHLPTIGVMNNRYVNSAAYVPGTTTLAYVNAGSIIDPEAMAKELIACRMPPLSVSIHPRAAVISEIHREEERRRGSSTERSGSTQKGVGAALAGKVMRRAATADCSQDLEAAGLYHLVQEEDLNAALMRGKAVTVEVPQGFGLSINHGMAYPHCTSRDCYLNSALSDAGIHPSFLGDVCMVVRTYPIRVGSLYNEMGEKIGDSGPFPVDSKELDWEKDFPGIEPERTTVTKRVRRIATWSQALYRRALSFNRPRLVALTFCDYLNTPEQLEEMFESMLATEVSLGLYSVDKICSWGNRVEDVGSPAQAMEWLKTRGPIR